MVLDGVVDGGGVEGGGILFADPSFGRGLSRGEIGGVELPFVTPPIFSFNLLTFELLLKALLVVVTGEEDPGFCGGTGTLPVEVD